METRGAEVFIFNSLYCALQMRKISLSEEKVKQFFDTAVVFHNAKQEKLDFVSVQESKQCSLPGTGFVQSGVIAQNPIPAWSVVGTSAKLLTIRSDSKLRGIEWSVAATGISLNLRGTDVQKEGTFTYDLLSRLSTLYPRTYTKQQLDKLVVDGKSSDVVEWVKEIIKFNAFDNNYGAWIVFDLFSFVNHSCVPNCLMIDDPSQDCARIIALREIKQGDELFTTYSLIPDHSLPDSRYKSLKEVWNVECRCEACVSAIPHLSAVEDAVVTAPKDRYKGSTWWDSIFFSTCHACGTTSNTTMANCSKCKCAVYCNKDCQRKHYKTHKLYCTDRVLGNQLLRVRKMLAMIKLMKSDIIKYQMLEQAYTRHRQL